MMFRLLCLSVLGFHCLMSSHALAALPTSLRQLVLSSDQTFQTSRWVLGQGEVPSGESPAALLAQAKKASLQNEGEQCLKKTEAAWNKAKTIQPWIVQLEVDCAILQKKSAASTADRIHKILANIEKNPSWLLIGPWVENVRAALIKGYVASLELDVKTNRARAAKSIDRLEELSPYSDESARAKQWRYAGEIEFLKQNPQVAREYMRRSLREAESDEVRARLLTIESALNVEKTPTPAKSTETVASPSTTQTTPQTTTQIAQIEASKEEFELVERVTSAMKGGGLITAVGDAVKLIRDFPGGNRAKWATDRVVDAYVSIAEKTDTKFVITRAQMVRLMESADADRVADWARMMYSRGQWDDCLQLSRKAIDGTTGMRLTALLDLGAKAAMATDRFDVARRFFDRLISQSAGTPASREALLRLGLMRYRMKEFSQATSDFERLLALPQVGQLELTARYWLWRSLQMTKSERAETVASEILRKYPFSYYGLRVRIERSANVLEWKPEPAKFTSKLWLTSFEIAAWERAQLLMRAGWLDEAQAEIESWPSALKAEDKAIRALIWSATGRHSDATKLANEAWDEKPELRQMPLVSAAFPLTEYASLISAQASARKVDKFLLRGLIKQESSFNVRAVSGANALGLMQLIPSTAKEIAQDLKLGPLSIPDDLFQPARNIQMGTYYLGRLINRYSGHVPLALAAYNAGPTRLDRWLKARPTLKGLSQTRSSQIDDELWIDEIPYWETSVYVKSILRNLLLYRMLDQGRVQVSEPIWSQEAPP